MKNLTSFWLLVASKSYHLANKPQANVALILPPAPPPLLPHQYLKPLKAERKRKKSKQGCEVTLTRQVARSNS